MRRAPARRGTALTQKQKGTSSGDRTHDHKIKSLALYHLSYGGLQMSESYYTHPGSNRGPSACKADVITN